MAVSDCERRGWVALTPFTLASRSRSASLSQIAAFPSTCNPHVLVTVLHEPADLRPPEIVVRVGMYGDRIGVERRLGRVVELLANPDVPHAEQEHDRRVSGRQGQLVLQIDLPALQSRDLVDRDQAVVIDAVLCREEPKFVNGENKLPVGSIAWADVSHGDSQKYDASTW